MDDLISRQAAISAICNACGKIDCDKMDKCEKLQLPPANNSETPNSSDTISRAKAIEALKQQAETMSEWSNRYAEQRKGVLTAVNIVEDLPPAQPEQLGTNLAEVGTDCISRQAAVDIAKDLIITINGYEQHNQAVNNYSAKIMQLPPALPEPCEDAVSRKAVKDGFVEMCNLICPYTEKQRHAMCGSCLLGTAFDVLEATQSVTPKQRTGYWYPVGVAEVVGGESAMWGSAVAYHKCSECDEQALRDDFEEEVLSDFCPHCGVKMEGVSEGDAE